jgi:hypothetical protein
MWKLWKKQGCRDLFAINCRFQGLVEEILKTHKTVLVNKVKDRSGSAKGWARAGLKNS